MAGFSSNPRVVTSPLVETGPGVSDVDTIRSMEVAGTVKPGVLYKDQYGKSFIGNTLNQAAQIPYLWSSGLTASGGNTGGDNNVYIGNAPIGDITNIQPTFEAGFIANYFIVGYTSELDNSFCDGGAMVHNTVVWGDGGGAFTCTNTAGMGFNRANADYQTYVGRASKSSRSASMALSGNGGGMREDITVSYTLRGRTQNATPTELYVLNSATYPATRVSFNPSMVLDALVRVTAIKAVAGVFNGSVASYLRRVVLSSSGSTVVLKANQTITGATDFTDAGFAPPAPALAITGGALTITVTGLAATDIYWYASIEGCEFDLTSPLPATP
jgi:hypothetical protein